MNLELDQAQRKLRLSGMADVLETRLLQAQTEQSLRSTSSPRSSPTSSSAAIVSCPAPAAASPRLTATPAAPASVTVSEPGPPSIQSGLSPPYKHVIARIAEQDVGAVPRTGCRGPPRRRACPRRCRRTSSRCRAGPRAGCRPRLRASQSLNFVPTRFSMDENRAAWAPSCASCAGLARRTVIRARRDRQARAVACRGPARGTRPGAAQGTPRRRSASPRERPWAARVLRPETRSRLGGRRSDRRHGPRLHPGRGV